MHDAIDKIKALLASHGSPVSSGTPIDTGGLKRSDGTSATYSLNEGWDLLIANQCDETWGIYNITLMRHIKNMSLGDDMLSEVLNSVQLDDSHWCWVDKSILKRGDEYRWFFLLADGKPQAACLIYHPKPSAANEFASIFYIDYIAVAPWNRRNPMSPQIFKGLGRLMVSRLCDYAQAHLKLSRGMCLHSLPKAMSFYESLGMVRFPQYDKDGLPYYELCPPATGATTVESL
jgi:hypothetical protein